MCVSEVQVTGTGTEVARGSVRATADWDVDSTLMMSHPHIFPAVALSVIFVDVEHLHAMTFWEALLLVWNWND